MPPKDDFGERVFTAWKQLELLERRSISLGQLGARVAKVLKRDEPYSPGAVRRWRLGNRPGEPYVRRAMAEVLGVRDEWLDTGEEPMALPSQRTPIVSDRTDSERRKGSSSRSKRRA